VKKINIKRAVAAVMVAVMVLSLTVGCNRDKGNDFETPEFMFVPEFIPLPDGVEDVSNLVYAGGKFYFTSYVIIDEENYTYSSKLFSMDIDGTNFTELTNYDPGSPFEDALGGININSLRVDSDGNLWVIENGYFYRIVDDGENGDDNGLLPIEPRDPVNPDVEEGEDGDDNAATPEEDDVEEADEFDDMFVMPEVDPWDGGEWEDLGEITNVRKLDGTGAEILSLDVSHLSAGEDYFWISAINVDDAGNIYLAASAAENFVIYVLGSDGATLFRLDSTSWIDTLIRMPDGSISVIREMDSADGWSRVLVQIDPVTKTWGSSIELPMSAWQVFPGGGDYDFLFIDNNNLKGLDSETGDVVKLLNWLDSGVGNDYLQNITILPDGRVICTSQSWDRRTGESRIELIILTRIPYDELPERTVLTLATVWLDWTLRSHIVQFNRTNPDYRIQIIDYSEFNTDDDWRAGLTKLSTDIISGKVPDMLDVSSLPFKQYVTRGLLEDLYTFIDSDPELSRSSFVESVFRAAEMDGSLHRVFPSFMVFTLVGHPSVLGAAPGWNIDEFTAVLEANPQADMPMGQWLTKDNFLQMTLVFSLDEYVDWTTGKANFDSGAFAQLLEFSNRFPSEFNFDYDSGIYIEENEMIASGRQIMTQMYLYDFQSVQWNTHMFGGDIVFKGFPTESRNGNALNINSGIAITTRCTDKEGAWEFMRTFLTAQWQQDNVDWGFPTNKSVFDDMLKEAMRDKSEDEEEYAVWGGYYGGMEYEQAPLTQQEADRIIALIDSTTNISSYDEALMNIIMEGAADYFSGLVSAQDAARVVQSRASIYISEQSG